MREEGGVGHQGGEGWLDRQLYFIMIDGILINKILTDIHIYFQISNQSPPHSFLPLPALSISHAIISHLLIDSVPEFEHSGDKFNGTSNIAY